MTRALAAWDGFWFRPESTAPLALLRIAFGTLVFLWTVSLAPDVGAFFTRDGIVPRQPHYGAGASAWGLLADVDGDWAVWTLWALLLLASVALTAGLATRVAAIVVWLALLSLDRRNTWILNSGDVLIRVVAFYLVFAPAGASFSLDRLLRARDRVWEFPARAPWALRLLQIQLSVVYLVAVWAKARGTTWNDGTAVSFAFRVADLERFPLPAAAKHDVLVSNVLTYGTLAIELSLALLVWNRALRPWLMLGGATLHLGIEYAIRVGFYSWAVLVLYLAFVPPERAERVLLGVRARASRRRAPRAWLTRRRRAGRRGSPSASRARSRGAGSGSSPRRSA